MQIEDTFCRNFKMQDSNTSQVYLTMEYSTNALFDQSISAF